MKIKKFVGAVAVTVVALLVWSEVSRVYEKIRAAALSPVKPSAS